MSDNKKTKDIKSRRKAELNDLFTIMNTDQGRRFIYRLLDLAGVYRISYTGNSQSTAFNEGKRNIGLFIQSEITESDEGLYFKMITEHKKEMING